MIKTATWETCHGGCIPDTHRLLQEARERAWAEKEDGDILC